MTSREESAKKYEFAKLFSNRSFRSSDAFRFETNLRRKSGDEREETILAY